MLAIIVLLEHSGMKISKTAQTGQDYEVASSQKSAIIKLQKQNQVDGGPGSGNFRHGGAKEKRVVLLPKKINLQIMEKIYQISEKEQQTGTKRPLG